MANSNTDALHRWSLLGRRMEDATLDITLLQARVDQLAALVTRCCARAGVNKSSDFDDIIVERMNEQEQSLELIKERFHKLEQQLEKGVKAYFRKARINFDLPPLD